MRKHDSIKFSTFFRHLAIVNFGYFIDQTKSDIIHYFKNTKTQKLPRTLKMYELDVLNEEIFD